MHGPFTFTPYFEREVLRKRPYRKREWRVAVVLLSPRRVELQLDGRYGFWSDAPGLGDRVLRVVTLADCRTIHNAFPDRRFVP